MSQIIEVCLTCTTGTSNKYWHGRILRDKTFKGKSEYQFESYYGRIGKPGQTTTKDQASPYAAFRILLAKVKEKVKKGYMFVPESSITTWSKWYEADLRVAAGQFFIGMKKLSGWINIPGTSEFLKGVEKPKNSIRKILEERRRTAPITI